MIHENLQEDSNDINMKYDYYNRHPKSRRNSIIGSIFMITFTALLYVLSDFKLIFLTVEILFSTIGVGIILNIKKNQVMVFEQHKVIIEWFTLIKSINEEITAKQINFIQFKTITYKRETSNYLILIQTLEKRLQLYVTPVQFYDLMPFFKKFCDTNHIKLIGYKKDVDNYV